MLSTKTVGNVRDAKHYFLGKDNYYIGENDHRSLWFGKGAEFLGLAGDVKAPMFEDLLKGKLPDGSQLGKVEDGKLLHRPGFDLTFSVPKSVSMVAMMTDDKKVRESIIQSIFTSVQKTLALIERSSAEARITKEGSTNYIKTSNIVSALFLHDLSRENEPDLHVHCVVMNMTKRPDGKWRSLASKAGFYGESATHEINGFFEKVRHHKKFFGALFRSELAYELRQKEFPIVITNHKEGYFEMDGMSDSAREAFSTRREKIKEYMEEKGLEGGKGAALATVMTRPPKKTRSLETLKEEWIEKGKAHGIDAFHEVKLVIEKNNKDLQGKGPLVSKTYHPDAKEAIQLAMDALSENKIEIKQMELLNYAIQYSIGKQVNLESITLAIEELKKTGDLITLKQSDHEVLFTTKKLLDLEQEVLRFLPMKEGPYQIYPKKIHAYLSAEPLLTKEQIGAVEQTFLSEHRISAIIGKSSTGKTFMVKSMVELAKLNGFRSIVLAPSKLGTQAIQEDIHKAPNLLQGFLKKLFDRNEYLSVTSFIHKEMELLNVVSIKSKRVIFVDNAELLSLKQMRDLFHIADKTNARLVVLGDNQSLQTASAGSPFKQIIEHGVSKVVLEKAFPNVTQGFIQEAIDETLSQNIDQAFKKIGDRIVTFENKDERHNHLALTYANLDEGKRKKTLILMPTKALCDEVNLKLRDALKDQKHIEQKGPSFRLLIPKRIKEAGYRFASSYRVGQVVRFNEMYASLKINKSDYLQIIDINKDKNIVTLKNSQGQLIQWDPMKVGGKAKKVEVFNEKIKEITVGECLIASRNNPLLNIASGEQLKVISLNAHTLLVERENHKKIKINLKHEFNQHIDYGYALTPYQAYNKKGEAVLAYQSSYSRQSHQRLFYKVLSQAKIDASIYTENKEALLKHLKECSPDKLTTIDAVIKEDKTNFTETNRNINHHIGLLEKAIFNALQNLKGNDSKNDKTKEIVAKEAVQYALAHLTEREASFQHKDVMVEALKHALGDINAALIQDAVLLAEKNGELVRGAYSKNGTQWTTKGAIALEEEILSLAKKDQGKLGPLVLDEKVQDYLSKNILKKDHETAIQEWMGSKDRVLVMQGNAGTGKTTLLERTLPLLQTEELLHEDGHTLLCLAPTHVAVKELKSRDLEAETLDSFLAKYKRMEETNNFPKFNNKLIIALDENSMASNKRERDFLKVIHDIEARAIVIGDTRQYASIDAGKPHSLLQAAGVKTIFLTDIVRQKETTLIKAVDETYQKAFAKAFGSIKDFIVEMGEVKTLHGMQDVESLRLNKIAEDYLALSKDRRSETVVITSGNKQRVHLNSLIREGLIKREELLGDGFTTQVLVSKDLTRIEKTNIHYFKAGDVVRFGFHDPGLNIHKDEYLTVNRVHKKEHVLQLNKEDGTTVLWGPKYVKQETQGIEVYRLENRELMQGDLIRWMRSDKKEGLLSPELARVFQVNKDQILLQHVALTGERLKPDGHLFEINPSSFKYKHWDHAYVMTSYGVQGKSIKHVMANMESHHRHLTTQAAFLINLTRSIETFTLYTDNKTKLLDKILRTPGTKTSALETIGKVDFNLNKSANLSQQKNKGLVKSKGNFKKINQEKHKLDVKKIVHELHHKAPHFIVHLLGEPKSRSTTHLQYSYSEQFGGDDGKKTGGSLSIAISGENQGLWHSFKTGEGGNLLSLIQKKLGMNFKESLDYAARFLGMSKDQYLMKDQDKIKDLIKPKEPSIDKTGPNHWSEKQKKKVCFAQKLAQESVSLKGTLAEKYLLEHRGITLNNEQENLRFHPGFKSRINDAYHPALLAVARNNQGEVQAVQAIFLDEKTANKADVKVKKQTFGVLPGASVDLTNTHKKHDVTYIAEGVETALSILQSIDKAHVKVTLGKENFKHPSKRNLSKNIVLCLDNDRGGNEKAIHTAAKVLQDEGKTLWLAKPEGHLKDYNDVLKSKGEMLVRENVLKAVPYEDYIANVAHPTRYLKDEMKDTFRYKEIVLNDKFDKDFTHLLQESNSHLNQLLNKDMLKTQGAPPPITDKLIQHVAKDHLSNLKKEDMLSRALLSNIQKEQAINMVKTKDLTKDMGQEI